MSKTSKELEEIFAWACEQLKTNPKAKYEIDSVKDSSSEATTDLESFFDLACGEIDGAKDGSSESIAELDRLLAETTITLEEKMKSLYARTEASEREESDEFYKKHNFRYEDIWELDDFLAVNLLPRLIYFRLTEKKIDKELTKERMDQWHGILNLIINGLYEKVMNYDAYDNKEWEMAKRFLAEGWDALLDLGDFMAINLLPRIIHFRMVSYGIPSALCSVDNDGNPANEKQSVEEWHSILDTIIDGLVIKVKNINIEHDETWKSARRLLAKWFDALWD